MGGAVGWRLAVPAGGFLAYVAYLVLWSPDPFLIRWIEGCFAFFTALVLAHVILKNSAGREEDDGPGGPGSPPEDTGGA